MPPEMSLLWEVALPEFLFVTFVLGGGGAWMIGRSTALNWNGWGLMAFYLLLLNVAVRFIHFSLFGGSFFLPFSTLGTASYYAFIDYVVLFAFAATGRSIMRNRQMARQYGFLHGTATGRKPQKG
jgi:hypothetical protein